MNCQDFVSFNIVGYLAIGAVVIIACILLNRGTNKLGVPMLLAFLALGMVFSRDGLFNLGFSDLKLTETICSLALIFIMFYGGFGTNWKEARPVAARAVLLSSLGVIMTMAVTGVLIHYFLKIDWLESFLIGSVVSSTDAASVFSILRSKRLNLKYGTASLLEVESGSNDPCSYMLTILFLSLLSGKGNAGQITYLVFAQIVYGAAIGVGLAFLALFVLKKFNFLQAGFDAAFVLAIALLSYALPTIVKGNGYLSAYIVGVILGNKKFPNRKPLVHFFDGVTGLMQMLIFFLLGLASSPKDIIPVIIPSLVIFAVITFIARPLTVIAFLSPFKSKPNQQAVVAWAGLRGATSIVFAILAMNYGIPLKNDIFHIIFCVVLLSIAFQGSFLPLLSRKLRMIDKNANVLKTFNDYTEENEVRFIKLAMHEGHPWLQKKVKEISLPPDTILAMIIRDKQKIIPKGNTVIDDNDVVVLGASCFTDNQNIQLSEEKIGEGHEWAGKKISEITLDEGSLIILVKRKDRVIFPNGRTLLAEGDVLVLNVSD